VSANVGESDPQRLEEDINVTRQNVDETLDALEERMSVRRRVNEAADAVSAAAGRMTNAMTPSITSMIRLDHTHVLAAFRRFRASMSARRKQALVANVCLALEVHAQLEEEIFYPALAEAAGRNEVLDKSVPEHDEVRALVRSLRTMMPTDPTYDSTLAQLIRKVLHHVADEETVLLPLAEQALKDDLGALGWEMTRRRMQLLRPHLPELATSTAQTFPVLTATTLLGVGTVLGLVVWGVVAAVRSLTDRHS
jgi:iron-sulfur cluster repair protein YtfE (RIC family)